MATLTIRDLDDEVKQRLRVRAAEHGRSMEAEVRAILSDALQAPPDEGLGTSIRRKVALYGGADLELPERTDTPRGADFSDFADIAE